ncbi:MAG: DUF1398 domain-containing protein [Ferruginibacter sp.]|nr:DUF1398 domain-containing protein [Ferruginibacter sp.]
MFQLSQIKEAHAKVKSGADFPAYVQDLIQLGVSAYDTFVTDGHTVFTGSDNYTIASEQKYAPLEIAANSDAAKFKQYLQMHQQGQTDYPAFCRHSAETGVEKWTVDMNAMTCTYYDQSGNKMLEEKIPLA